VGVEESFQQRSFGRPWRGGLGVGEEDNINVYVVKLACCCIIWSGSFIPLSMMDRWMWMDGWFVWVIILVLGYFFL